MSRPASRSVSSASIPLDASEAQEKPDEATAEKTALIMSACHDRDLRALVHLATTHHGFVNDSLRRTAWPLLLGCCENNQSSEATPSWSSLSPHRDEEQVAKDVNRAFVSYPKESEKQIDKRKKDLSDVIVDVLRRFPSLCYFQGYHDIVQVLYLVLGTQEAPPAVARLSLLRIRDYMLPSLDPAIRHLELLPIIIRAKDPALYCHLPNIQPNYALGATLTLFSHVIEAYGDITRLFDFFLASDAAIPVYFFASIILSRRKELLELDKEEDEAIFYVVLGKLPQPFDIESRIKHTIELYDKVPPQSLRWAWWQISSASVLKATKTPYEVATLSLDDGLQLLRQQEREVRMRQTYEKVIGTSRRLKFTMWRYRRPGAFGLAIAVGIYALWLGRSGGSARSANLWSFGDVVKTIMGVFV